MSTETLSPPLAPLLTGPLSSSDASSASVADSEQGVVGTLGGVLITVTESLFRFLRLMLACDALLEADAGQKKLPVDDLHVV